MAIFNSYVKLPEGNYMHGILLWMELFRIILTMVSRTITMVSINLTVVDGIIHGPNYGV